MIKRLVRRLHYTSRRRKYQMFLDYLSPKPDDLVVDVGAEVFQNHQFSNLLEQLYPHPEKLVALCFGDPRDAQKHFPKVRFVAGTGVALPFVDRCFDIAVSNAVLEHVGSREDQRRFVDEMRRVADRCFISTPNRRFPVELHARLPFVQHMPKPIRDWMLRKAGKQYMIPLWGKSLNLLSARQFRSLFPDDADVKIIGHRVTIIAENLVAIVNCTSDRNAQKQLTGTKGGANGGSERFICFVGIDGSGKTLQAEKLTARLQEDGVAASYIWCRYSPRVLAPLLKAVKRVIKRKKGGSEYEGFTSAKKGIFRKPVIGTLWLNFCLLEYLAQVTWAVRRRLRKDRMLVCDRYIYDMLADMAINLDLHGDEISRLVSHPLIRLFPVPDKVFFLDVPPDVAWARKDDPNVMGKQYLVDRAEIYTQLGNALGFLRIDGTKSINEIADLVLVETSGREPESAREVTVE